MIKELKNKTKHLLIGRLIPVIVFSVGTLVLFAQEEKIDFEKESKRTAEVIVMLRIEYDGRTPEFGAGIVLGGDKDRVFIATADHVVHKGTTQPKNILVKFKKNPGKQFKATLLKSKSDLDLAVISVEGLVKERINGCAFPFDRLTTNETLKRGDIVLPVGNPNDVSWAIPVDPDKISEINESHIVFQSTFISGGHSGGGLLDENGQLVGMTTADQPPFGRAITMNKIIRQVKTWNYPVLLTAYGNLFAVASTLHDAATNGNIAEIKKLLANCKNPDEADINDVTPLHLAAASGQTEVMSLLLNAGANIEAKNIVGEYPLHSGKDKINSLRFLIKSGAKINTKNIHGETVLHYAAAKSSGEIVRFLIESGAEINAQDLKKNTPLHHAIECGNMEAAKALLNTIVNLKNENSDHETPLISAVEYQKAEMIPVLIAAGADINYKNSLGQTALQIGVKKLFISPEIIRALVKAGAKINDADKKGNTALHNVELLRGNLSELLDIFTILLKGGAQVNTRNSNGHTPLLRVKIYYAKSNFADDVERFREIEKLLVQHGAKYPEEYLKQEKQSQFARETLSNYTTKLGEEQYYYFKNQSEDDFASVENLLMSEAENNYGFGDELSVYYGNRSWYLLFVSRFKEAEQAASKGLFLRSLNTWIKTNLAHAILFQGRYDSALKVYEELKPLTYRGRPFPDICLEDLDQLEKKGINNTDVKKIRTLLEKWKDE